MDSLKKIRTSRGISQEYLAEQVGVSRQTISKWENGTARPSADNLMRLSQVFQLPVEAFLRDDWKPPEQPVVEAVALDQTPEVPPEPDPAPATEVPPAPVDEAPPPRRRNNRLWAALAAIIVVVGIIAGMISFKRRGGNATPISEMDWEEVEESIIIVQGTLHP